jgi:hypothetical protein
MTREEFLKAITEYNISYKTEYGESECEKDDSGKRIRTHKLKLE